VNFPDEKRFACNICPARFKDSSSCRRHVHEHMTGKIQVCSICSVPFKRPAQLKIHLQQQHGTANSVFSGGPGNIDSTNETFDTSTSSPDLKNSNSVTFYSSRPAEVFAAEQQLQSFDTTAEEADSSERQSWTSLTICHNSDTAHTYIGNQTATVSSASNVCDDGFSVSDKSVAIAPQTLHYVHNSCSASESNVLFSVDEDAITDVTATSNAAGFSMAHDTIMLPLSRSDITDGAYLLWHEQFADAMCSAAVPLASDQLQSVTSVCSSLVSDMTTMMTDAAMSGQ